LNDRHFAVICRVKERKNPQKLQMRRDIDRFLPKSPCRLRYQACRIPRILRTVGRAGLRGLAVRFYF